MSIGIDATYRDEASYPAAPLNLPENTSVRVRVVAQPAAFPRTTEEVLAIRQKSPRFNAEQLDPLMARHGISAPLLPTNFSRAESIATMTKSCA